MSVDVIHIHAGLHKTGSTKIQEVLERHHKLLEGAGLSRWRVASNHSRPLRVAFGDAPFTRSGWAEPFSGPADVRNDLAASLRLAKSAFLVSGEGIGMFKRPCLKAMRRGLEEAAPEARQEVVVYVRRIDRHLNSFAQQKVQSGSTIAEVIADPSVVRYRERIGNLFRVFGRANVDVRLFPEIDEHGPDALLRDFLRAIGAPKLPGDDGAAVNPSLSQAAVLLLDAVNTLARGEKRGPSQHGEIVAELRASMPGPSFRLPAAAIRAIVDRHVADIEWLIRQTGLRIRPPATLPEDPRDATPPPGAAAEVWRRIRRFGAQEAAAS